MNSNRRISAIKYHQEAVRGVNHPKVRVESTKSCLFITRLANIWNLETTDPCTHCCYVRAPCQLPRKPSPAAAAAAAVGPLLRHVRLLPPLARKNASWGSRELTSRHDIEKQTDTLLTTFIVKHCGRDIGRRPPHRLAAPPHSLRDMRVKVK
ncbi:hypothetical protein TcasGA2_TC003163 [Tribolium castaneum]|uniref:Uncharacterized protein n=1 Tax=Tribolium castaneum TaxID=7070 RepID=D6WEW2_TRICA|nr:hypothetical protein TcasGA2_TC003163 [Tribolium castaneum]